MLDVWTARRAGITWTYLAAVQWQPIQGRGIYTLKVRSKRQPHVQLFRVSPFWALPDESSSIFPGGGWCYSDGECENRARTMSTGGSGSWERRWKAPGGMFSDNCTVNPAFCQMTRVYAKYCDGGSWSGNLATPYTTPNATLYFRGQLLLDALLSSLADRGLGDAHTVVISGCSAGGLTTLLQSDYIGEQLRSRYAPTVRQYMAVAVSGYFLFANDLRGVPVYPKEMKRVFERGNASAGVNAACVRAQKPGEEYKCISGAATWAHMVTPTFIVNSAFDYWQTSCILAAVPEANATLPPSQFDPGCSDIPGWRKGECGYEVEGTARTSSCNPSQMRQIVGYQVPTNPGLTVAAATTAFVF